MSTSAPAGVASATGAAHNPTVVTTVDYRLMPSATREQLISALDPRRELSQSDVLAQLERVDGREREQRMLTLTKEVRDLTQQIKRLTAVAAVASVLAVVAAGASLLLSAQK